MAADAHSYRPANGTEGDIFYARLCAKCAHEGDADRDYCQIWTWAQALQTDDPAYPRELVYDQHGQGTCLGFEADDGRPLAYRCSSTPDLFGSPP
jgi:hypothetical protein